MGDNYKEHKKYIKKLIKEYVLIAIGTLLIAITTCIFLEPNHIAFGGVIGMAIILHKFLPLSVGLLTMILTIILFVIAIIIIGPKFGAKTIYSSFILSMFLLIFDNTIKPSWAATDDIMLATLIGTILFGIGMGIVLNQNSSTGSTDILAKIITRFSSIHIGKALLVIDFLITIGAGATFGAEIGMYSILAVIINGITVDMVVSGLNKAKVVMIISVRNEEISKFITEELGAGCTFIEGKGGYSGIETNILYAIIDRKKFVKLRNFIKDIDPKAFIVINNVNEVLGGEFRNIME